MLFVQTFVHNFDKPEHSLLAGKSLNDIFAIVIGFVYSCYTSIWAFFKVIHPNQTPVGEFKHCQMSIRCMFSWCKDFRTALHAYDKEDTEHASISRSDFCRASEFRKARLLMCDAELAQVLK